MDLSYGLDQFKEETELYSEQLSILEHCTTDFDKFKQICVDLEFNSIIDRLSNWQSTFNKKSNSNILAEYFKAFV